MLHSYQNRSQSITKTRTGGFYRLFFGSFPKTVEKQKSYGIIEWVMKMKSFNYEEMFAQSIGLQEPWRVERVEYDEEKREVHIYVKARKTSKYPCPECGKMCARYDDEEEERIWRHGDVCFFPCYVHCRRPRIKC